MRSASNATWPSPLRSTTNEISGKTRHRLLEAGNAHTLPPIGVSARGIVAKSSVEAGQLVEEEPADRAGAIGGPIHSLVVDSKPAPRRQSPEGRSPGT